MRAPKKPSKKNFKLEASHVATHQKTSTTHQQAPSGPEQPDQPEQELDTTHEYRLEQELPRSPGSTPPVLKTSVVPSESNSRKTWILIAAAAIILILAVFLFFIFRGTSQSDPMEQMDVILDGESGTFYNLVYENRSAGTFLFDANGLLRLLGEEQSWRYYELPRNEFRFSNTYGDVAGMREGSNQAQFYTQSNQIITIDTESSPVLKKEHVYVPAAFVEKWLGITISYDEQSQVLTIDRIAEIDEAPEPVIERSSIENLEEQEREAAEEKKNQETAQAEQNSGSEESSSEPEFSGPPMTETGLIDCTYQSNNKSVTLFAKQNEDRFYFVNMDGTPLLDTSYAAVGSKSHPEQVTYTSRDGSIAGVITGMKNYAGIVLYGVISFDQEPVWVVPCKYDDIWMEDSGQYVGHIYGGADEFLP